MSQKTRKNLFYTRKAATFYKYYIQIIYNLLQKAYSVIQFFPPNMDFGLSWVNNCFQVELKRICVWFVQMVLFLGKYRTRHGEFRIEKQLTWIPIFKPTSGLILPMEA